MAGVIATYNYTYGNGDSQNRQIQFSRTNFASSIQAQVYILESNAATQLIAIVSGKKLSVKNMEINAAHLGQNREQNLGDYTIEEQNLGDYTIEEQNAILGDLKPKGQRSIEITNGLDSPSSRENSIEQILFLTIYGPSRNL